MIHIIIVFYVTVHCINPYWNITFQAKKGKQDCFNVMKLREVWYIKAPYKIRSKYPYTGSLELLY